jgi:hypothetical protein
MPRPTTSGIKLSPKKAKKLMNVSCELAFLGRYVPDDGTSREEAIARKQSQHAAKDIRKAAILFASLSRVSYVKIGERPHIQLRDSYNDDI